MLSRVAAMLLVLAVLATVASGARCVVRWLRTVIWNFAGDTISGELLKDLEQLRGSLEPEGELTSGLTKLVDSDELDAVRARLRTVLRTKRHPDPGSRRRGVPWPSW